MAARARVPLPRSPLYLSQNISISPEPRPITGLTPRVVSRVASHNSPGIIFAAPPRRPPRTSPRFRQQTKSFSIDESERSSAAYEQQRSISGSMDDSTPMPTDALNLHEELRHSSLRSVVTAALMIDDALDTQGEVANDLRPNLMMPSDRDVIVPNARARTASQSTNRRNRNFIFSSPRFPESEEGDVHDSYPETNSSPNLPLPPPFSTARRTVSNSESLPGSHGRDNLAASPIAMPSSSPAHSSGRRSANRDTNHINLLESPPRMRPQGSPAVCESYVLISM